MTASDKTIAQRLLHWYDANARGLPWRAPPGTPPRADDSWPYRVWLAEVMLQQTTVAAVIPRYAQFLDTWPDVTALAAAGDAEVMAAWAGLGYYSRARNLLKCAREVAARGGFPRTEAELRRLPGVGSYTAAAVAAIAFDESAVVVDANVERVVARLFAIEQPLPAARAAIRDRAGGITPAQRAGDHAQAMMDLGATICTPRNPRCDLCPLSGQCMAFAAGDAVRFPVRPSRPARPQRTGNAWWFEREGRVWLVTRPDKGMLGAMRALPDDGWSARADGNGVAPAQADWVSIGSVEHQFTHFSLTLAVHASANATPRGTGEWWPVAALDQAGLPTLFAKAARLARA